MQQFIQMDVLMESAHRLLMQTSSPTVAAVNLDVQLELDAATVVQWHSGVRHNTLKKVSIKQFFLFFSVESITASENRFRARRCASEEDAVIGNCSLDPTAFLGGEPSNARLNLRGIFHLTTNAASPFAQG